MKEKGQRPKKKKKKKKRSTVYKKRRPMNKKTQNQGKVQQLK